ncbi:MAG: hypothetical protein KAI80_09740, partial [Hyphomicrobiaceae bacterium]|nr:hypothetical protein [Hyphomicrobiaceae bacterium]
LADRNEKKSSRLMSDAARDALRRVARAMRKAAGIKEPEPADTGTSPTGQPGPPGRRAGERRSTTFGAVQPRPGEASRRALP